MTHQTLYRKYRSNNLDELVGQSHIIQTITNAIAYDRLAHAYIFSGPRGTGKTSTARILAKMVNQTTDNMADCPLCQKIGQGNCVDVIEIDAASHTGVDYMRQLIDQVQFLPVEASHKVFIIDEVHMLSTGAFNALLKTLEEPPKNIVFILATTELHKIPATIQSRSQTLHFRLLDTVQLTNHLSMVSQKEGVKIDPPALQKVVAVAKGGMRDALSLLDQLMNMATNQHITLSTVASALGTVNDDDLRVFLDHCFLAQSQAHTTLVQWLDQGIDPIQLYDDIVHYMHAHWLSSASEASSVSPAMVSDWLIWFCDQMGDLKVASSPALRAQIGLYARLNASVTASSKAAAPEGVSSVAPVTNASKTTPLSQRHSAPPSRPVSAASPDDRRNEAASVASGDDAQQAIIQKISAEFPVLMPVIKGATLMLSHNVLYLVLDETYQFFQKKLSEPKFKDRFLALYNEHHKSQVSEWLVTTDVNDIYAAAPSAESSTHDTLSSSATLSVGSNQKTSKTVNQIIEMFDGQIIQ